MFYKLKSEKGITGIDLSISIIIIMLFVSIIAALLVNVSTSLNSKNRLQIASNCMTEIIEKLDEIDYSAVEETQGENEFKTIQDINNDIYANYDENVATFDNEIARILQKDDYKILSVYVKAERYVPESTENPADLVKTVTVKITYKLNNQDEMIEVSRVKTRYNVNLEESN